MCFRERLSQDPRARSVSQTSRWGSYTVSIIVPAGYTAGDEPTEVEAIVDSNEETVVNFSLQRLVTVHRYALNGLLEAPAQGDLTGRGHAEVSQETLFGYLNDIQSQYYIFDDTVGLEGMQAIIDPPKPPTMRERAEQRLMALLMNLVSLRIAIYTEVSLDDTCGEAIDFIISTMETPGTIKAELETAKDLAEDINNGLIPMDFERIPEL